jgi:hypothetical protein
MKKPPVTALSLSLSLVATATSAGRLTAADVEGKPEATTSRQTNWVLPVLIGGIVLYALAGGGNDDSPGGADTSRRRPQDRLPRLLAAAAAPRPVAAAAVAQPDNEQRTHRDYCMHGTVRVPFWSSPHLTLRPRGKPALSLGARANPLRPASQEHIMKKIVSSVLALSLALSSTAAFAGGPVIVVEEGQPEVVAETPRSGWIVPVIIGGIILCAIACGDDDEEPS